MASSHKELRLLLVGLTGSGKSSTANTLVGKDLFSVGFGSESETSKCQKHSVALSGHKVQVMDSPGLFDTDKSHEENAEQVVEALFGLRPGPHAILYVVNTASRYTEEQYNAYKRIKEYFGNEVTKFTIVVFTHGDNFKAEGKSLKNYIPQKKKTDSLNTVLTECGSRAILIDNKTVDTKQEVGNLMTMLLELMKQNGDQHFRDTFPPGDISRTLKERVQKAEEEELKKKQHVLKLKTEKEKAEREKKEAEKKREEAEKKRKEAEKKREEAEEKEKEAEKKRKEEEKKRKAAEKREALREAAQMEKEAKSLKTKAIVQAVFALPTAGVSLIGALDRVDRSDELKEDAKRIRETYN